MNKPFLKVLHCLIYLIMYILKLQIYQVIYIHNEVKEIQL
jgi:hypothetical protein